MYPFPPSPHPSLSPSQSKATAVAQLFQAHPDRSSWTKFRTGVVCFVKDNIKKSYYIRLVDIGVRKERGVWGGGE